MIAAALALLPAGADAGERAVVPGWQWVDIERCSRGPYCKAGDSCGIEIGSEVVEIGRHGDRVLVRYDARHGASPGTPCDGGEVFWLDADDFATMTERYKAVIAAAAANSSVVDRLLKEER